MVTGDSGCEAYTAIAWGVGLSLERSDIAGAEGFHSLEGNMCGTVSEVLTPCRGLRPHHVQKDRIGSWEVSGLTGTPLPLPARIGKASELGAENLGGLRNPEPLNIKKLEMLMDWSVSQVE